MWPKNIRLFQFHPPLSFDPDKLHSMLAQGAFKPCPKSHAYSYGFTQPTGDEAAPLVYAQNNCMLIRLRIEEKVLPSTVVRETLANQVKEIEQKSGRRIYKDEKERLKDEIYQTLLTKAFTKSSYINAYIDTTNNWLIIDCASTKKLAHVVSMLMKVTDTTIYSPEYDSIPSLLTKWLLNNQSPDEITVGHACLLKDPEETGSIVRVKNENLYSDKIQAFLLSGSICTQLTAQWQDNVQFTLKEDFSLGSVKFLEAIKDLSRDGLSETPEERLASDFIIMTQTLDKLLNTLLPHFVKQTANTTEETAAIA